MKLQLNARRLLMALLDRSWISQVKGVKPIIGNRRLRITLIRAVLRLIFGASLIFFSIRDFLFGNGLYIFRDWTWPLSTSLPPIATFSPEIVRNVGPDPMGFVRMFINWPIVVIDNMTGDPIIAEKAYVIYFFALLISLFFILG